MTIDRIDWSKLKSYAADKRRSFEELCYQLVRLEHGAGAHIVRVDGAGGDGGVEFYLTLPSGDELGWQAKFFWPDVRLNGTRKKQIKKSLQRACDEHRRLVAWHLMTPSNLTTTEQQWFDVSLRLSTHDRAPVVPKGRAIELVHVPESELLVRLVAPQAHGLRTLFFGDLELSLGWFQGLLAEATEHLRSKFLPTLHSSTSIDAELEFVLGEQGLSHALDQRVNALAEALEELRSTRRTFDLVTTADPAAKRALAAGGLASDALSESLRAGLDKATAAAVAVQTSRWRAARDAPPLVGLGLSAFDAAWGPLERLDPELLDLSALGARGDHGWPRVLYSVERSIRDAWRAVDDIESHLARLTQSAVHIFGAAGQGKTHVSAHQVMARLDSGRPAILLLGSRFTTAEPLEAQILRLLHLEGTRWDDFVSALAACAETYGTRIPIVIDGLNEALHDGGLSPVWRSHLAATCAGLRRRTRAVVLVTTCRTTYEAAIWEGAAPPLRLELEASTSYDVQDAIEKYFSEYKIVADPTSAPLEHFQHPIYLRLFCEAHNPDKKEHLEVSLGEETLFRVFDKFLAACEGRARRRLKRLVGPLVEPALQRLGALLWRGALRSCPMSEAASAIEQKAVEDIDDDTSLLRVLEQEDVLILRDWYGVGERVGFVYDLMGGYCIAKYLIDQQRRDAGTFADPTLVNMLFGGLNGRHPLAEDIVRALAVLCPTRLGRRIHDLIQHAGAFDASVVALFEGDPEHVTPGTVDMVTRLFEDPSRRHTLLQLCESVATNLAHPLNARYLSRLLGSLPMPDRDSTWSEHLRGRRSAHRRTARVLETAARAHVGNTSMRGSIQRLHLTAIYTQWFLTSTVRPLRDEATRALYWFGRACPLDLLGMLEAALSCNDPYVPERMMAAQYGVMMARAWERGPASFEPMLQPVARKVFELVFARGAPFPVTHFLTRGFARGIVCRALVERPSLLSTSERKLLARTAPITPKADWPTADDPNEGKYRDGNSPLDLEFANSTIGHLVPKRGNYDFKNPEYRKVRGQVTWRLYDLGYSLERFGEIDKAVMRELYAGRTDELGFADRYGRKYARIAYLELAGIRHAAGLLGTGHEDQALLSEIDIEPSFPSDRSDPRPAFVPSLLVPPLEPLHVWLRQAGTPDLKPLLERTDIIDDAACVLLAGLLREERGPLRTEVWLQSYVVSRADADRLVAAAGAGRLDRVAPEFSGAQHTFAGEYPWLPEIEPSGVRIIELSLPPRKRERVEQVPRYVRDGKEVGAKEVRDLLFSGEGAELRGRDQRAWLRFAQRQLRASKITIETARRVVVEELQASESIAALSLVRDRAWEGQHTTTAGREGLSTLAPEVARALSLHTRPDDWELFEAAGTQVTRNLVYGERYGTGGALVYGRRGVLEKYLTADQALVVLEGGERLISGSHMEVAEEAYDVAGGRGEWRRVWVVFGGRRSADRERTPARAARGARSGRSRTSRRATPRSR